MPSPASDQDEPGRVQLQHAMVEGGRGQSGPPLPGAGGLVVDYACARDGEIVVQDST
jgi:hypothetical protein